MLFGKKFSVVTTGNKQNSHTNIKTSRFHPKLSNVYSFTLNQVAVALEDFSKIIVHEVYISRTENLILYNNHTSKVSFLKNL